MGILSDNKTKREEDYIRLNEEAIARNQAREQEK